MQPEDKNWKIRTAVIEDAPYLQQCMQSAYSAYQERMGDARLPPMDLDYADEINNYPTWVAEFDNRIVGGLTMIFSNGGASIANVAVDPQFQGKGLGSGLLKFAESQAKLKHFSELHLATHVLLTENISLYNHLGWSETERDEIRVYMKKDI
jgi:N-acetylglutamate synthase-like GNAT family acetyltransferase